MVALFQEVFDFFGATRLEYALRILLATALGAVIGIERSLRLKEAGFRTHCIIACTAALFMILSKYAFTDLLPGIGQGGADATMIACQVVNGINFLGAGIIFQSKDSSIFGLTTATGIWATAAVGLACGSGLYAVAAFSAALIVFLPFFMHRWKIGGKSYTSRELRLTFQNTPHIREILRAKQQQYGVQILNATYTRKDDLRIELTLQVRMTETVTYEEALALLNEYDEIQAISI